MKIASAHKGGESNSVMFLALHLSSKENCLSEGSKEKMPILSGVKIPTDPNSTMTYWH